MPILSWLMLRGKCGHCHSRISPRYAFVELLTGLLFLAVFMAVNPPGSPAPQIATLWYLAFTGLLIIATFTDFDHWIIPAGITTWGTVAALGASVVIGLVDKWPLLAVAGPFPVLREFWGDGPFDIFIALMKGPVRLNLDPGIVQWWEVPANAVIGAVAGPLVLYGIGIIGKIIFRKEAMGMGDVYLFALIGATLGVLPTLLVLMLACVFGAIAGGINILRGLINPVETRDVLSEGEKLLVGEQDVENENENENEGTLAGRLVQITRHLPKSRRFHHLPFGPWISLAAVVTILFFDELHDAVIYVLGLDMF